MIALTRSVQVFYGKTFTVDPVCLKRLVRIGICKNCAWGRSAVGERVSGSPHSSRSRVGLEDGAVIYFKRYVYPPKRWFEFMFRPGKAAVEAWAYATLKSLGIPTLEVVALGGCRILGPLVSNFIVPREVPDTQDLSRYGPEVWVRPPYDDRMRLICRYLGEARRPGDVSRLYQEVARNLGRYMPTKDIIKDRTD